MCKLKLTKEKLEYLLTHGCGPVVEWIWKAIESDREAVRADTRDELLKDHFKIGEEVRSVAMNGIGHLPGTVVVDAGQFIVRVGGGITRPPKKRPPTNEEKCVWISRSAKCSYFELTKLDGATIEMLYQGFKGPAEVEE